MDPMVNKPVFFSQVGEDTTEESRGPRCKTKSPTFSLATYFDYAWLDNMLEININQMTKCG